MIKFKAILGRRWYVLAIALGLGLVTGFLSAATSAERGITLYDAPQVIVANRLSGNPANVSQDALKASRGPVAERAAQLLDEPDAASRLVRKLQVKGDVESNSIKFIATDTDPERASAIVQAFVAAFLEVVNEELRGDDQRQIETLSQRVEEAQAALQRFDAEFGFIARPGIALPQTESFDALIAERQQLTQQLGAAQQQLEAAELRISDREPYSTLGPEKPTVANAQLLEVPESPLFRAGLLGLIGLLLGLGLVVIIERVNQRIDTRDELAALISVPIIAEIGKIPARQRATDEEGRVTLDGVWSEHYRRVRSAIQFVQADAVARAEGQALGMGDRPAQTNAVIASHRSLTGVEPRIFVFVSALPGEGKSTSVALTAQALAETGTDTLVINADFRRPMVERFLGVGSSPSLADRAELTTDRPDVQDIVQKVPGEEHLWVAASGKPTYEVGGRLAAAKEVAAEAAASGGTVLIDTSPLRVSNDPIDLLASVDEVILVVRAGRTTVKSIEDTIGLLEMHHAPLLGVVLIGTLATREMYAYYQSYYRQADESAGGPGSQTGDADDLTDAADDRQQGDAARPEEPAYAREDLDHLPEPPQYLPPPPPQMPPPYGQPGSA